MPGITAYGAYIPLHRLSRGEIARAWGSRAAPGERAVASYDEDSLTMAVAAARDCLRDADRATVGAVYCASTTAPYKEKQSAAAIASVLDLPPDTATADFGGSLRCGTNALKAALDAVAAGSARSVLVCAADMRLGYPAGAGEMDFGDGAVALLVGAGETLAEVTHFDSRYWEIQDTWRSDQDAFVRTTEDRFSMDEGYADVLVRSVAAALEKYGLAVSDVAHFAFNAPNVRQVKGIAKKLRFDEQTQVNDALHASVGDTGCAASLLSLVAALERSRGGETILLACYGNGCDTAVLEATDRAGSVPACRGVRRHIESRRELKNYEQYLRWRGLLPIQPAARPPIEERVPSPAAQWREVPWEMRLTGTRCLRCGTPQYPLQRVCVTCHAKDEMEPYRFTDVPARLFSFSHDYVMETLDTPVTVTFVDFEGGGRLMCDMTDRDPDEVVVGMPLEMSFRRLYYVNGVYNYWWKCQPVRCQQAGTEV
jgi:3-hydroxy-3-methylglutaryl CoA synthase